MIHPLENRLKTFLSDYTNHGKKKLHVLVAVSGGVDSMGLLWAAVKLRDKGDLTVSAAYFLHHPEGENAISRRDLVANFCRKYDVNLKQGTIETRKSVDYSPEEWMRDQRYTFLRKSATEMDCDYILTGHHADDQAETVLARILTGAGIAGLRGIHTELQGVLRPFLAVRKSDIAAYCEKESVPYIDDPENEDETYPRNYLRRTLLPLIRQNLNPDVDSALTRLNSWATEMEEILEFEAESGFRRACSNFQKGKIILDLNVLLPYFKGIRKFIILRALRKLTETPLKLTASDFDRIETLVHSGRTGSCLEFPGGLELYRDRNRLVITNVSLNNAEIILSPGKTQDLSDLKVRVLWGESDFDNLISGKGLQADLRINSNNVILRYAKEGDHFYPMGAPGEKRLFRFLTDQKVSRPEKRTTLVLLDGDQIAWVVGHRISEHARVNRDGSASWRITLKTLNHQTAEISRRDKS